MNVKTPSVIGLLVGLSLPAQAADKPNPESTPITLSNAPQLFLDDHCIDRTQNLTRRLEQPRKHPANPLGLVPEYAWERSRMDAGSVIYDDRSGKFRMWYTVLMDKDKYADNFGYLCYAESSDGVTWHKPMMRLHDFEGHLPTNIVSKGPATKDAECLFPAVIKTPHDPARLYKMFFTHRQTPDNRAHYGLHVASSKDGLRWTEPRLIFNGKCDNPPSLVWSAPLRKYFGFCRAQDRHKAMAGHIRSTGILESLDFDRWTPRKKVVITDQRDGYPFTQFHHVMVTQYGPLMIGMAGVMHMLRKDNKTSTEDVQLICSRDGWNWHRVADRAVFIPNGPADYDREMISPRSAFAIKDDTVYIYYQGARFGQGQGPERRDKVKAFLRTKRSKRDLGGICLATLPADRFVAMIPSQADAEGVLQTKPLLTTGQDLLINAQVAAGDLKVEVLDGSGKVLPGFERSRCRLIAHDALRYRAVWGGSGGPKSWKDLSKRKPLALRFFLRAGALYAFQVTN